MKKLAISFVAVVSAIIMCFAIAGCASSVAGKTFVYDDIEITYDASGLSDAEKKLVDAAIAVAKETTKSGYVDFKVTFETDGTTSMGGKYIQKGGKVYISDSSEDFDDDFYKEADENGAYFTVSGNKLIMEMSAPIPGVKDPTFKIIFKAE